MDDEGKESLLRVVNTLGLVEEAMVTTACLAGVFITDLL
jgi:hypothetical protein